MPIAARQCQQHPRLPVLVAGDLVRSFRGPGGFTLAVEEVRLPPGTQLAVVGPSGCGKSTLLGLLSLALRPDHAGVLQVSGVDAAAMWRRNRVDDLSALRADRIGFVPQTAALLPFLSLGENIALPQRILRASDVPYLDDLAEALGIRHLLTRRPAEVSVGERQRAAVARALAHRPQLVLADEPTASVHPAQADEILGLMVDIAGHVGAALVITTHDRVRAEAAGFAIAPCRPDRATAMTSFAWTP